MFESFSGQALAQWRNRAQDQARLNDINPMEVDWVLRFCTDVDSLSLRLGTFSRRPLIDASLSLLALDQLWQRRLEERCPVQYLLGKAPWREFILEVSPAVLIPRPETELLIDIVQAVLPTVDCPDLALGPWLDLGTGSGAIAIGLASILPQAQIYAIDSSGEALAIAKKNVQQTGFETQIHCLQGSWWQPVAELKGKISAMVSNPPYIPSQEIPLLQPEVAWHEPLPALDGGGDGLETLHYLVKSAPEYLRLGGFWLVELMAGQAPRVADLLRQENAYQKIEIFKDLAGIERFVLARRA